MRAVEVSQPGLHTFSVTALQNDDQSVKATGNFEIIAPVAGGQKIRNIILMVGDGMGAAHRTAGRIVAGHYAQGKATQGLAMDSFPVTGMIKTASLNSIVTDSSPGMTAYVLGNKNNNNEEGVFPDDTLAFFDNPRIEYLSEYLHRTQGKALGIVTTADVYDATPAGNAIHTSNRRAGTGIADQFLDDRNLTGLTVLMGGGRKWFLPKGAEGSARNEKNDYVLAGTDPHTAEIVSKWGASAGKIDESRNLIADFQSSGFQYATDKTSLDAINPAQTERLLGLFAYTDMNVALDKINGRRGVKSGINGSVVANFGFPDQPMLDEMAAKAIAVLDKQKEGFVLMVEGASIDKQSHEMDTDRWVLDLLEFDRAVKVAQDYAKTRTDTLVIVTADHECSGAAVVGASMVSHDHLDELIAEGGVTNVRDKVVGAYEKADFPHYQLAQDGYPEATNVDKRLLISYGANADRFEDWRTNPLPIIDTEQQPMAKNEPLRDYPKDAAHRAQEGKFFVTGQVPGAKAVHTGTDIPLSAYGPGAWSFTGVLDNTDVFFTLMQSAVGGVVTPAWIAQALKP
jgi:alkaline phosphatase